MKRFLLYILLLIIGGLSSCGNDIDFLPKPKGYHRLELPKAGYKTLEGEYPYHFEHSVHAEVIPDTSFISQPYWVELYYPELTAQISISYKPVRGDIDSLMGFSNTSHKLTFKHTIKASAIEEFMMVTPNGDMAFMFELEGDVPSQFQYYVTDSTKNFLRAALYFPTSVKNDSLKPVIDYVKKDMMHMLNTTEWRNVNTQ